MTDTESRPTSTIFTPVVAAATNSQAPSTQQQYVGILTFYFSWDEARAQVLPLLSSGQDIHLVMRTAASVCTVLISQKQYQNLGQGACPRLCTKNIWTTQLPEHKRIVQEITTTAQWTLTATTSHSIAR